MNIENGFKKEANVISIWRYGDSNKNEINDIIKSTIPDNIEVKYSDFYLLTALSEKKLMKNLYNTNKTRVVNKKIYLLICFDNNPKYKLCETTSNKCIANVKMISWKKKLREIFGGNTKAYRYVHASCNLEESILFLESLNLLNYYYKQVNYKSSNHFFNLLNESDNIKYVLLNNNTTSYNILVDNYYLFKSIMSLRSLDQKNMIENNKWCNINYALINNKKILFKIYFPEMNIVNEKRCFKLLKTRIKIKLNNLDVYMCNDITYTPVCLDYFLNCELPERKCKKKAIVTDNYKLKTVREVVNHWKKNKQIKKLTCDNWDYWNCVVYGFRFGVESHDKNKDFSDSYYIKKKIVPDDDLEIYLFLNPSEFEPLLIRHSWHRTCAMIGRLIRDEKYIPFYMKNEDVFCGNNYGIERYSPMKKLGNIINENAINPVMKINNIETLFDLLKKYDLNESDYAICQSSIISLMGGRKNSDIDIIFSTRARNKVKCKLEGFDIMTNNPKFNIFGCKNDDELITKYSVMICGLNFVEPRFYFSRIFPVNEKKVNDQRFIRNFRDKKYYTMYPYNLIPLDTWGFDYLPKNKDDKVYFDYEKKIFHNKGKNYKIIYLEDIPLEKMVIIKNRSPKPTDKENHNRIIYKYDKKYYKIWDKEYVHLNSFLKTIKSKYIENDMIRSFVGLIFDKEKVCRGYITFEGIPSDKEINDTGKLYEMIKLNAIKYRWFFSDLYITNVVKYNSEYCLIDIEQGYSFDDIVKNKNIIQVKNMNRYENIKPKVFRKFIESITN